MRTFRLKVVFSVIMLLSGIIGANLWVGKADQPSGGIRSTAQFKKKHPGQPNRLNSPRIGQLSKATHIVQYDSMDVQVVDRRQIAVSGSARVMDRRQGNWYVWLLRIYSADKVSKLLKEHHYIDTAVQLPPGSNAMNPTFMDVVDLRPGTYKVELTIYSVLPTFDPAGLKFGEDIKSKSIMAMRQSKKVTISP